MPVQVLQQRLAELQLLPPLVVQWLQPQARMRTQLAHPGCSTLPPAAMIQFVTYMHEGHIVGS